MRQIPVISGQDAVKALYKLGYRPVRQKGSHIRLSCPGRPPATVPAKGELSIKTTFSIIKQSGLTIEEFLRLLD